MTETKQHKAMVTTNRTAETVAFLIGVLGLGVHMLADALAHLGFRFGECVPTETSIPWVIVIASLVLILPKTVGRARAGAIVLAGLNALTLRLSGRGAATAVLSSQHGGEEPRDIAVTSIPEGGGTAAVTVDDSATVPRTGKAVPPEEVT